MPTSPTASTALPEFPSIGDASYNAKAYAWATAFPTFGTQINALATNVYNNAVEADADATTATLKADVAVAAAAAATLTANASAWVNGGTYALNSSAISGIDYISYRKKTASSVTTIDPSSDPTNWTKLGGTPRFSRSARTSNTILAAVDLATLIDITSGTFTQTFDAAATLGDGWYCYIKNSGTGDITLDPNASETIDGLTSFVMYPGEQRLVLCTGTAFTSFVMTAFAKTFTASGTFTKPPGYIGFEGLLWAAGTGGGKDATFVYGGGGGGCTPISVASSLLSASESVTIGAGGTASATATLNPGGNSVFALFTAYGGSNAGAGGNSFASNLVSPYAGGASATAGTPVYGGAGGGVIAGRTPTIYGGGGGGGINSSVAQAIFGTSIFGGSGGSSGQASNGGDGTAPGGGGGSTCTGTSAGAGARGELQIWGII